MRYYIIEHPTRGTLQNSSEAGAPRWSWSKSRLDEDNVRSFGLWSAMEARAIYCDDKTALASNIVLYDDQLSPGDQFQKVEFKDCPVCGGDGFSGSDGGTCLGCRGFGEIEA